MHRILVVLLLFVMVSHAQAEPVEILRDEWGVAHVYAQTQTALFFGAGYATAQDRMLQMDLTRRAASGRLAEVLGSEWVESDILMRTLGLYQHALKVAESLPTETQEILAAYAAGINHYLSTQAEDLNPAFDYLGWTPEPWTPADSIAVWMRLSERFDRSWKNKVNALRTHEARGGQAPPVPIIDEAAAIVSEAEFARTNPEAYARLVRATMETTSLPLDWDPFRASHAWVVSGEKTTTGSPLLESDPQIAVTLPSLWYEIHLDGAGINARGIGVAGAPGFLIGWNEYLAWGGTALGSDATDLFLEQLDPSGTSYLFGGEWLPLSVRTEEIQVKGGRPVSIEVKETHHGPLVSAFLPGRQRHEHFSLHYAVTQEMTTSIQGMLDMLRARDWNEFRQGLAGYRTPGLHIVYADIYGNIGYHTAGAIPLRQGTYGIPQIGWTGEEEWSGYIPIDELPHLLNPERNYIASANHLPVGGWYPYNLTIGTGGTGHTGRSYRLYQLLAQGDSFSVQSFEEGVHRDNRSAILLDFLALAQVLAQKDLLTQDAQIVLEALAGWDGRLISGDSVAGVGETLLASMHRSLQIGSAVDALARQFGGGSAGNIYLLRTTLAAHAVGEDLPLLADLATWVNGLLGPLKSRLQSRPAPTRPQTLVYQANLENFPSLYPRANRPLPALTTTVIDTIWSQPGNSYTQIVDLHDIDNSRAFLPPGVSEDPRSPHFFDQVDLWIQGATRPAPLSRHRVLEITKSQTQIWSDH